MEPEITVENPRVPSPHRDRRRDAILFRIARLDKLISPAALRLTELVADPHHEFQDVITTVRSDAGLTAAVLKAVNSVACGLTQKITSIERAVTYLGERFVVSAALKANEFASPEVAVPGYDSVAGGLWDHNLRTAIASREIALCHNRSASENLPADLVYICGLLHDLGKFVLSGYMSQVEPALLESMTSLGGESVLGAEENLLGINHVMAGNLLAKQWKLPAPIPSILKYHHRPHLAIDAWLPMTYAVHLGNQMSSLRCSDEDLQEMNRRAGYAYKRHLNLSGDAFEKILFRTEQEYQRVVKAFAS